MAADLITLLEGAGPLELFTSGDIYRWDIDNRPLLHMSDNFTTVRTKANAVIQEVYNARTDAVPTAYGNLKARLDAMDLDSGYASKLVLFDLMHDRATLYRAQFGSGFFCRTGQIYDQNNMEVGWPTIRRVDSQIPYGALVVRTIVPGRTDLPTNIPSNSLWMSTHGDPSTATSRPIDAMVGGYHVSLYSEKANGAAASGFTNGVSILFPDPPAASGHRFDLAFLEVWFAPVVKALDSGSPNSSFYPYGAVDSVGALVADTSDPAVRGTVSFYAGNNGDYVQIRHRIRVVSSVDATAHPFGMTDPAVVGRGGAGSPVGGKIFTSAYKTLGDGAVWMAGDGSSGDKTALGSIDGYVYAIPICIVSRRNTGTWSLSNQNGAGTWRPDGLTATDFVAGDVLDLRPRGFTDRSSLATMAEETFDAVIRGQLHSRFGRLAYDTSVFGTFVDFDPYGTELLEVNYIANSGITNTAPVRDFIGSTTPTANPDNVRRVFSPTGDVQLVGFTFNSSGSPSPAPTGFVAYDTGTHIITITAGTNKVVVSVPIMSWRTSKAPAVIVGSWSGLGTATATAALNVSDGNYSASDTIDAAVDIQQPRCSGTRHAPNRVDYQEYVSPTSVTFPTTRIRDLNLPYGISVDSTGNMYLCDTGSHRVIKYNSSGTKLGQFGVTGTPAADNSHLNNPVSVAVDAAGNMYVADRGNHRIVKISGAFAYSAQFGTTGTPGNTASQCNTPVGVAVDSSGNVYISDSGNARITKLDNTLTFVSQFGVSAPPTFGTDKTHVFAPGNLNIGGDGGNLYVADSVRVLVINPSTMLLITTIVGGRGTPEGAAISAFSGIRSVSMTQDSSGNIYIAGGSTSAIYKLDSNYNLLARFGDPAAPWDGSPGSSTTSVGATSSINFDSTNSSVWITDYNANFSPFQSRILILNSSDLSFKYQRLLTNPRPWMDGIHYPVSPNPAYTVPWAGELSLDVANRRFYLPIQSQFVVEKWSCPTDNPSSWSYTAKYGDIVNNGVGWVGWGSSGDNSTRLGYPRASALSTDGNSLFIGDGYIYSATSLAGRVVKLSTSGMTYSAQLGDLAVPNGGGPAGAALTPYMQFVSGIVAMNDIDRVYITDAYSNPARLIIANFSTGWTDHAGGDSAAAVQAVITDTTWVSVRIDGSAFLAVCGANYARNQLFINPGAFPQIWSIAAPNAPVRVLLAPGSIIQYKTQFNIPFSGVTQVWESNGVLLIVDKNFNLVYAMSVPGYYPIGKAGTTGVSSFGLGGWSQPSGIAYDGDYLYLADLFNGHMIKASRFYASIERGSGRIETLFPMPSAAQLHVYSRYTPYQGVGNSATFIGETDHCSLAYFSSHVVQPPNKLFITTRGRVGIETGRLGGDSAYVSPLAHLPLPNTAGDEYAWPGTQISFAGGIFGPTSQATMPVVQAVSNPLTYAQDSESFAEPDTQFIIPEIIMARGFGSWSASNDAFPGLKTFGLAQAVNRLVYAYGIVEYLGELLLFVRGDLVTGTENGVGLQLQNPPYPDLINAVDLYRLRGNPFGKFLEKRTWL